MPPSACQNMNNLTLSLPIRTGPTLFLKFKYGKTVTLTTRFFHVVKLTNLRSLSLIFYVHSHSSGVSLKISSLLSITLKSPNRILIWYIGEWSNICSYSLQKLSFASLLSSSVGHKCSEQ